MVFYGIIISILAVVEALNTTGTFPELAIRNHTIRLETVGGILLDAGVVSIAELDCGDDQLIETLVAEPSLQKIVGLGVDRSAANL